MVKPKKNIKGKYFYMILLIFLGGFIGSLLGEILGFYTQEGDLLHKIFTKGIIVGLTEPFLIDIRVLVLTFGLKIKFSFLSIMGLIFGFFLYTKTV